MSFCSLCRVPATAQHKSGGWHKHNKKLKKEGKMPLAKDLYDKFEAPKYKSGKYTTAASAPSTVSNINKKNVNAWHWEERNCMPWAKTRIPQILKATDVPIKGNGNISITDVQDIKGDAYVNMRKGKFRVGYAITIGKIYWKGEIKADDGTTVAKCKGTCEVPEICEDADDDDYDVTNIKLDDDDAQDEAGEMLLSLMKSKGKRAVIGQLKVWANEMLAKKNEMKT